MLEQLILIAFIQGITEFLPVSSSGHLGLIHAFVNTSGRTPEDALALDVAVHLGTLVAVLAYNRADIGAMIRSVLTLGRQRRDYFTPAIAAIIGTIPVVIAGYYLNDRPELLEWRGSIEIIAWATLIFGIVLGAADRIPGRRRFLTLTVGDGIVIGLAQALALIPGTSRAGITMTAARFIGLGRRAAVRFSMILSIPVIIGAGVLKTNDMIASGGGAHWEDMAVAALVSMVVALLAINIIMAVIDRIGFMPFVIYRILLGAGLLGLVYLT